MELKDKKITCKDCGSTFIHTVKDQQFYAEMGFANEPVRCRDCRDKKKSERNNNSNYRKTNNY